MNRISLDLMQLDVESFPTADATYDPQEAIATDAAKFCTGPLGSCLALDESSC